MFCPLDCWDSCELSLNGDKFSPTSNSKFLCYKLNNYFKFPKENNFYYNQKIQSKNFVLNKLVTLLKNTNPKKVLFLKGSGNMGIIQNVTKLFFEEYGAVFGVGSTCDGIGEKGIIKGRKKSLIVPTWVIKNTKNIIIWGRNPYVTNTHLLAFIKNKKIITIDVIPTKTAKNSDYFIQVKPNSDYFLAIALCMEIFERKLEKNSDKKFKELVFSYDKKELLNRCGVTQKEIDILIETILEPSVILEGLGVSKCKECYKTTWAIDSLFYLLDYFGKNDRGVGYLGSSGDGLNNPFDIKHKNSIPLFDIDLDKFDIVFIQGANPLRSFVGDWSKLKNKKVITFGKYFDETAKISKIFIPTKDFFAKKDIRGSYFNEYILVNESQKDDFGISEYQLTKFLFKSFGMGDLKSEDEYIKIILNNNPKISENFYLKQKYQTPTYKNLDFRFLDEKFEYQEKELYLVTGKSLKSLNSQFVQDDKLYINPKTKLPFNIGFEIVFDKNIPEGIIYTTSRKINKFLKAEGENGFYDEFKFFS